MKKIITAYKGFNADWTCRDFQFEVGKTYKADGDVVICSNGFHACESPFDVWSYYGVLESKFAEVELSGDTATHDDDSKIAAAEITIKAEITMPDFIKRGIGWLIDNTKGKDESGYSAKIGSSGDSAQIGSSGDYAKIGSSGYSAKIKASGKDAVIASAGYDAKVKGGKGTWVSVAEYNDSGKCIGFATGCIGKNKLKPDTWYKAEDGKLVAA